MADDHGAKVRGVIEEIERIYQGSGDKGRDWGQMRDIAAMVVRVREQSMEAMEKWRLDWLAETLEHCPHAIVRYNGDPDEEDDGGMVPVGWSIRISGCYPLEVTADTFRGVIDAGIAESKRVERNVAAGRAVDDDGE